jgi:NTE family protein
MASAIGMVVSSPIRRCNTCYCIARRSRLPFQVDLFHARGRQLTDLEEVCEREKDIRYSNRIRAITDLFRTMHDVRQNINSFWDQLPENLRSAPEAKFLYDFGCVTTMDIVEFIYRPTDSGPLQGLRVQPNDARARWAEGLSDARTALLASPWLAPLPPEIGARTFDVQKNLLPQGTAGPSGIMEPRQERDSMNAKDVRKLRSRT